MSKFTGFKKLKENCIHLYCRECGRKKSNVPRWDIDLVGAELIDMICDKCVDDIGAMNPEEFYYKLDGTEVTS